MRETIFLLLFVAYALATDFVDFQNIEDFTVTRKYVRVLSNEQKTSNTSLLKAMIARKIPKKYELHVIKAAYSLLVAFVITIVAFPNAIVHNSIYGEYATTTHRFVLVYYLAITSIWFFKCILKSKRKAELALMIAVSLILRLIFSFDFLVPINQSRTIAPLIEEVYKHIITIIVIKLYSFCTGQGPQVHASDFAVAVGGYMRKGTLLPYQFLRLTFPHALLNYLQFCSFKNSKENFWKNTRKGLILTILVHSVVNFFRSIIVLWLWISIWSNLRIWTNL
jgi:hypothetical protein